MAIISEPVEAAAGVRDLPDGWRWEKFGEVVRNVDVNVRNPLELGIDRYLGLEHIDPESLHVKRWGLIADGITFTRKFTPGQVLFGKRRAYQRKVAVAEFEGICSGDILVFEPANGELIPELLPFIVQSESFFQHALGTSAGSLSPRTRWRDLAAYEFALPPKDEQRRIAEILWAAEKSRLVWEKCLVCSHTLLESVVDQTFSTQDWPRQRLSEHLDESAYGPRFSNAEYSSTGAFGCIRTTDLLADGSIIYETVPFADLDVNAYSSHILHDGDFLISRSGTCGIAAVYSEQPSPMVPGAFLIRLRLKDSLNPWFLKEYINSSPGQAQIQVLQQGGVQKNIRGSSLVQESIPVPSLAVQLTSVEVIEKVRASVSDVESHLSEQKLLATALLRELLAPRAESQRTTHV